MRRLVCLFKGHIWSDWCPWITGDKDYRWCIRCGKKEFKV